MRLRWLGIFLLIATSTFAQSGVGGGGQSNVGGGGSTSPGSPGTVGGGASPVTAFYLSPQCPVANTNQCFFTPANTQQSNNCAWTATQSTVTCSSYAFPLAGSVTGNVVTYVPTSNNSTAGFGSNVPIPSNWQVGDSITVTQFTGGDTYLNQTCTISTTSTTAVTCPLTHANGSSTSFGFISNTSRGPFVAGDVGKQAAGWASCQAFEPTSVTNGDYTASGAPTISTFTNSRQVGLSANAANTVAANGCFVWGTPDDSYAAAAEAVYTQAPACPRLVLAAGYYMFTQPHFTNNPIACASLGTVYAGPPHITFAGNLFYSAGFTLEGRGNGATQIYLMPNFPNGVPCNQPGGAGIACFVVPLEGRWTDIQLTGGGNMAVAGFGSTFTSLIYADVATLDYVTCTNFGGYSTAATIEGLELSWQVQLIQYNNSGCGNFGIVVDPNVGGITGFRVKVENSAGADFNIKQGSFMTCYDCGAFGSEEITLPGGGYGFLNQGGTLILYRPVVSGGSQIQNASYSSYGTLTNAGSVLIAHEGVFNNNNGVAASNGILCVTSCTNYLQNTSLTSGASGFTYKDAAGSFLYDQGGNTFGATARISVSGSVVGSNSIAGTALANGNVVLSTCGTSAVSAASGSSVAGQFTITFAGAPGTACTWTLTYPVAFLTAPLCTFTDVGGTNVFPTSIVNGTVNATTAAATETATAFTNGNTEIVQYRCQNP